MNDERENAVTVARLIRTIAILALPYESQVEWLAATWVGMPGSQPVDELAEEFGQSAVQAPQLVEAAILPESALYKIEQLDSYLASRGGPAEFWTYDALRDDPAWAHVRHRALSILIGLDDSTVVAG